MDAQRIISSVNGFLHGAAVVLVDWLNDIFPKVTKDWWEECVLPSLSCSQQESAVINGYSRLSDFDLAALLRITNQSWYSICAVAHFPTEYRELVTDMMSVRRNWVNCGSGLPGKDTIIHDLNTISGFIRLFGKDPELCSKIKSFISSIDFSDIVYVGKIGNQDVSDDAVDHTMAEIKEHSLVYLVGSPETKGVVISKKNMGDITQYEVFVNNAVQRYFSGQIAPVEEETGYRWVGINDVRSYLTAYQINNPSSQNLYSLHSARIDFVPYQFRPALKMIHADEPRILIADSVGVGKTIEAGLIIKELEARSELERVVVICPRPLVAERKWEIEMKRFDEEFIPIDGTTLRQI